MIIRTEEPVNIGVVGCGVISAAYFKTLSEFSSVRVLACADLDEGRAKARAKEFGVPQALSVEGLLADPDIQIVLNLTVPSAHAEVALAALESGKSVYNEKPLSVEQTDANRLIESAKSRGLSVGCAPDTFLGAGHQTCRKLIDEGAIGEPIAAAGFFFSRGPESWHPDPEFYYKAGGGPLFDMGPYYLTALINLLGPAKRVCGMSNISFPERTITSAPKFGSKIPVEVATHVGGLLELQAGTIATILMSFDIWAANLPRIEIYGSEGTISAPDPNSFGGPVRLRKGTALEWIEIPLIDGYAQHTSRGIGVVDMAQAMQSGRSHRASGELAYHVLDIMYGLLNSSTEFRHIEIGSTCERPAPMAEKLE